MGEIKLSRRFALKNDKHAFFGRLVTPGNLKCLQTGYVMKNKHSSSVGIARCFLSCLT